MEKANAVPIDMNKRRFIAQTLNIPPMLFGLAILEDITLKPHTIGAPSTIRRNTLQKVIVDTDKYQKNIRILSELHYTSQVQHAINLVNADISDLDSFETQARGNLLYRIRELLFSYHALAAKVIRDQRKFSLSYHHANQAVRVARNMDDSDLIAAALYVRGCTYLEWGMFGTLAQGVFQTQEDKIIRAINNFEDAMHTPENGEEGLHPQLLGFIRTHLSRAYAILKLSKGEKIPAVTITMLDDAADGIDNQSINDSYTRMLVTGTRIGFIRQRFHSDRAVAFNAAGMYKAARQELNALDTLQQGTVGKDLTRYHSWLDVVRANTFMGLGEYKEATSRARAALISSRDISSMTNITNIVDIYGRLLQSPYDKPDVQELGDMLHEVTQETEEEQVVEEEDY